VGDDQYFSPPEDPSSIVTTSGFMNLGGLKLLIEAGVKNPVLEVAAKELGIEVQKLHAAGIRSA